MAVWAGGAARALPQSPKPPTHSVAPGKMSAIASSGDPASLLLPLPLTQRVGSTTRCLLEKQRRWPRSAAAVTPLTRPAIACTISSNARISGIRQRYNCIKQFRPKICAIGRKAQRQRTTHKHERAPSLVLCSQPHAGPRRLAPLFVPTKPLRLLLLEVGRRLREHEEDARPAEE